MCALYTDTYMAPGEACGGGMGAEVDGQAQVDRHQLALVRRAPACHVVSINGWGQYASKAFFRPIHLHQRCNAVARVQATVNAPEEEVVGPNVGVEDAHHQQSLHTP